uniref:Uncharacterized protein n=1 Tax=Anguilla anguilla TaxID=7936 RepID=A0A0E9QHD4_ANGAN
MMIQKIITFRNGSFRLNLKACAQDSWNNLLLMLGLQIMCFCA